MPERLEPVTPRSPVKHSTTESLCSPSVISELCKKMVNFKKEIIGNGHFPVILL